jgi:ribosomal-protein-alanine N-acetyltransferase
MLTVSRYQLRPMLEGDIAQVVQIERESFPTTWPQTAYRRELANRMARYLVVVDGAHAPVTQPEQRSRRSLLRLFRQEPPMEPTRDYLVGYIGVWLLVDQAHVVAIAVREAYRRRGIGELLLLEAVQLAIDNRQENVTLEVRRSNVAAQALYEKYRFLKVGVRKRYYSDNHEDAIIMSTPPIQDAHYKQQLAELRQRYERRWGETD